MTAEDYCFANPKPKKARVAQKACADRLVEELGKSYASVKDVLEAVNTSLVLLWRALDGTIFLKKCGMSVFHVCCSWTLRVNSPSKGRDHHPKEGCKVTNNGLCKWEGQFHFEPRVLQPAPCSVLEVQRR